MGIAHEIANDREKGAQRLFEEYGGRLTAAALALCGNETDAKDLVWETIDIAVREIGSYRSEAILFEWLYGIMQNRYRHSRRRKSATNEIPFAEPPDDAIEGRPVDGAAQIVQALDAGILRDAVNALPPEMREAVVLRYFMEMPLGQIAKFLSLPVGTVKSRLHYARIALARRLGSRLKKPAVALIAAGLFLAASAATVWTMVRTVVAEDEDSRLKTVDVIEATFDGALPDGKVSFDSEPVRPENDLAPTTSTLTTSPLTTSPLTTSTAKGKEDMNIRQQAATALAAATLAVSPASATTVAWYHFNEGEAGEAPAGGQPVILNAVDPDSLPGVPRVRRSWSINNFTGNESYLPVYTNDFPSCVSWYDPVTGARGADTRCAWMHTQYNYGHGDSSIILVDDDAKLHCANITVECMVKLTVPSGSNLRYPAHLLVMRNVRDSNVKAWGLIVNTNGTVRVEMHARDATGTAVANEMALTTPASAPGVVDGKWHHVALTYDGTTVRIYVDYGERASKVWAGPIDYNENLEGKLNICGLDVADYGGHWYGFMDEVRISSEALPPEKFLRVGGLDNSASDADTVIYLPLNSLEFSTDNFFGTVGQPVFHNSACSTDAGLVDVKVSTISYGLLPRLDTGASAVAADELHAGVFATNAISNKGCWTFTNNQMVAGTAIQTGKSRHISIDDYSNNNGVHLISSGDFTAEFYLKLLEMPTRTSHILCENSGAKGGQTIDLRVSENWLYCSLASQEQLEKYESGEITKMTTTDLYRSVTSVADGQWHHVALVISRTNQTAELYVDGNLVRRHENFVLASSVCTKNGSWPKMKIGDRDDGNNTQGFHNMSIDEFRITRRALAPQEFLMAGAALADGALEPTRAWIGFEGDLSVAPSEGAIPEGTAPAAIIYSPVVPGERILDGSGNVIRSANVSSMKFSASGRVFVDRNILLEREMTAQTVEFFMKGTNGSAKAWAYFVRLYSNTAGAENAGERMWTIGYSDTAGHLYVLIDNNGGTQPTCYVDSDLCFADGRWHHVAVTFEPDGNGNTRCKVYRDHVPVQLYYYVGNTKMPLNETHTFSGLLEMGEHGYSCMALGNNYDGWLDEVRISKGVLTVDQMMHVQKRGTMISVR